MNSSNKSVTNTNTPMAVVTTTGQTQKEQAAASLLYFQERASPNVKVVLDGKFLKFSADFSTKQHAAAHCILCRNLQKKVYGAYNNIASFTGHLKRVHGAKIAQDASAYVRKQRINYLKPTTYPRRSTMPNQNTQNHNATITTKSDDSGGNKDEASSPQIPTTTTPSNNTVARTWFSEVPISSLRQNEEVMETSDLSWAESLVCKCEVMDIGDEQMEEGVVPNNLNDTNTVVNAAEINSIQQVFDERTVKFFIDPQVSLKLIESTEFKKLLKSFNDSEGLNIMNRRTLMQRINQLYDQRVKEIYNDLHNHPDIGFCSTIEIWKNIASFGNQQYFLIECAHWINNDLDRKSVVLGCKFFNKIPEAKNIFDFHVANLNKFCLPAQRCVRMLTDFVGNHLKQLHEFGVDVHSINFIEHDTEMLHDLVEVFSHDIKEDKIISNCSHDVYSTSYSQIQYSCTQKLMLCLTEDLNNMMKNPENAPLITIKNLIMGKCNLLWALAGQTKIAEVIKQVFGEAIKRPTSTRWTSLYESLQQIQTNRDKFPQLSRSLNSKIRIASYEFTFIEEFVTCVKPIAEALEILQNKSNTFYGIVLPCLIALRRKLHKVQKMTMVYCGPVIKCLMENIEKRFQDLFLQSTPEANEAALAAISYPRFKNKWLPCLDQNERLKITHIFKMAIIDELAKISNTEDKHKDKNQHSSIGDTFFHFNSDSESEIGDDNGNGNRTEKTKSTNPLLRKAEVMMEQYFVDNDDIETLNQFPQIKNIFIQNNMALPTAGSIFTKYGELEMPAENKLPYEMYEKRFFLKMNSIEEN